MSIELTKEQVAKKEHEEYNPAWHDFRWHEDGSVTVVPLRWNSDASYIAYQSMD
jgi:hypothetical protein